MIVWRGAGALVLVIVFLTSLCGQLLTNNFGGKAYWFHHSWPFASVLVVAGGIIAIVDWRLAMQPKRVLIDEQTKERVVVGGSHDFFFIPMKWWSGIVVLLGILVALTGWTPGPA
jgi:hypothetical protein